MTKEIQLLLRGAGPASQKEAMLGVTGAAVLKDRGDTALCKATAVISFKTLQKTQLIQLSSLPLYSPARPGQILASSASGA